jgi:hypothetical protein
VSDTGQTAIAGTGATEFPKKSGRSELRLVLESATAGLRDASLTRMWALGLANSREIAAHSQRIAIVSRSVSAGHGR